MTRYEVFKRGNKDYKRLVKYLGAKQTASCACLMFKFAGIPCSHILRVLKQNDYNRFTEVYILKRWTKYVKRGTVVDKEGNLMEDGSSMHFSSHHSELSYWANKLVDIGLMSKVTFNLVRKRLREAYNEANCLLSNDGKSIEDRSEDESKKRKKLSPIIVHDPDQAKTKGRNKGKRMKAGRENLKARNRMCNRCKRRGQNHDARNCPFLKTE